MDFYRGDDRDPKDAVLVRDGFSAKPPAKTMSGVGARGFLAGLYNQGMRTEDFAFKWRGQTPGFLVSTAMTQDGGFQQKAYFYKISIPNTELTFQVLNNNGSLGQVIPAANALNAGGYLLAFNNGSYLNADVIAVCHMKVNTKEATFLTAIPARYIVGERHGADTTDKSKPFTPFH